MMLFRYMIKAASHIMAASLLAIAVAVPSEAQSISGEARAADGDSLVIADQRIRLFGIDAPELDQTCDRDGSTWRCGEVSKAKLAELIAGQRLECRGQGVDQYGRVLAICSGRYGEVNRIMVEQGWAVAFRQYSDAYAAEELRAKAAHQGLWASTFVAPSEYRQSKHPAPTQRSARVGDRARQYRSTFGCTIKGNRNRRGEWIYHLPGMPYYEQTRPEELFCTEAEAQAAGYRRAIVRP